MRFIHELPEKAISCNLTKVALSEFCDRMFREPERLVQVHCHRQVTKHWTIALHAHPDLLQLDLSRNFQGQVVQGSETIELRSTTAFVFYPG